MSEQWKQVIIGVDPSVAKTGICVRTPEGCYEFELIASPNGMLDPGRLAWIAHETASVAQDCLNEDALLCIERPGQQRGNPINVALFWRIREELAARGQINTLCFAPTQLIKFATGRGNADAQTVGLEVQRQWGDVLPSREIGGDEIMALILVKMGECWLGEDKPWTKEQLQVSVWQKKDTMRELENDSTTMAPWKNSA